MMPSCIADVSLIIIILVPKNGRRKVSNDRSSNSTSTFSITIMIAVGPLPRRQKNMVGEDSCFSISSSTSCYRLLFSLVVIRGQNGGRRRQSRLFILSGGGEVDILRPHSCSSWLVVQ